METRFEDRRIQNSEDPPKGAVRWRTLRQY